MNASALATSEPPTDPAADPPRTPWPWKRLRSVRPRGPFGRAVLLLAGATAATQLLVVAATPILTRLYTPSEFGTLAVFISLLTILLSIVSLRYELAVPLASDDGAAVNVLAVALLVAALVSVLTAAVAIPLADPISDWAGVPQLADYIWLLPVALLGGGVYQCLSYWAIRRQDFRRLARTRLAQAGGQVGSQVIIGALVAGPIGLLIGAVLGRLNGTGALAIGFWREDRPILGEVGMEGMKASARRYRRFPQISSGSALLNVLGAQLPALLLSALYGAQVLGWFALGQRVIGLPMTVIGVAVAQVYFGHAATFARTDRGQIRALFFRTARRLAIVGAVPIIPLAIAGPWLFSLIFGPEWEEAGQYVRVLSLMFLAQLVAVPLAQTLNVFERLDLQLLYDAVRLVLAAGGILLAYRLGWPALAAVASYAAGMLIAYVLSFWLSRSMFSEPAHADEAHD